jgi:hypothetical protein
MSMSTDVKGFVPPDERWQDMAAVWNACIAANIVIPLEVVQFFGDEAPDPAGVEVDLPLRKWNGRSGAGYELAVADIPERVKVLRFYNSW